MRFTLVWTVVWLERKSTCEVFCTLYLKSVYHKNAARELLE